MSVNYLNSWNWIFMMSDAPLTYTIFPPVLSSDCIQTAQMLLSLSHTHLPSASSWPPLVTPGRLENCTPAVTRSFSRARSFRVRALNNGSISRSYLPFQRQPPWNSCEVYFALINTMLNQRGLASSALGNPRCLWAQTPLWPQMWLVNCTSKEDKST